MSEPRLVIRGDGGCVLVREAEGGEPEVFEVPPWVIRHLAKGRWWMEVFAIGAEAAAPDPVASRQRWDYDEPHPFESKDMGNPTYDFCICERPRTDVMHPSDPVARPADAAPRTWREVAAKYRRFLELAADYPDAELDVIEAGAVASPAPRDAPHEHQWVAVGTERNFGGGIGWVIQSCVCGEIRRVALPRDYPVSLEGQPVAESPDAD